MSDPKTSVTRRYANDAQYADDAHRMLAAGWRVASAQRVSPYAIDVTYTPVVPQQFSQPSQFSQQQPLYVTAHVQRRALIVAGAILGGLVLLAIIGGIMSAAMSPQIAAQQGPPSGAQATNAAFTASLDATATAQAANASGATVTPTPVMIEDAQLGGPLSAFDTTLGPETSQNTWNTTIDGQQAQIMISGARLGDSADGSDRAVIIDISGADTSHPWTTAQATTLVASFLPSDATHVRDAPGWDKLGPDHIYLSQQLAASLTAGVFQDAASHQVTPGTFDWQCSTAQQMCEIGAGTNS